jgi:hypothetical protein
MRILGILFFMVCFALISVSGQSPIQKKFVSIHPRFEATFPKAASGIVVPNFMEFSVSVGDIYYSVQVYDWSNSHPDPENDEPESIYAELRKKEPFRSAKESDVTVNETVGREFNWTYNKSRIITWVFVKPDGLVKASCQGLIESESLCKTFFETFAFPSN